MRGQKKVDMMVSYINEKYADDTFKYERMSGGHLGSNTVKIIVSSEKYPGNTIRVICNEVGKENIYSDTYLNVKFQKETEEYLKKVISEEFGENIYLEYIPDDSSSFKGGSDKTTFEQFVSDPSTSIYISAAVRGNAEDEEAAFSKIKAAFSDCVLSGNLYFFDTEEKLSEIAPQGIEKDSYSKRFYFIKKNVDEYLKAEWTDGI